MRFVLLAVLLLWPGLLSAQTPEDVERLIRRVIELDSMDITRDVKFRAGFEPLLAAADADESSMMVLADPYEPQGKGKPGAFGWYRVRFTVPEMLGAISLKENPSALGVESNFQGSWEAYTYVKGSPAGAGSGYLAAYNRSPTEWVSNAPLLAKPGDEVTLAFLVWSTPLAKGNPEGFAMRHLRLRFASRHTFARFELFGNPVSGTGLNGARQKLSILKDAELKALRIKLQEPLRGVDAVFSAAKSGKLDDLTQAMRTAAQGLNAALK
jgi:hypothetical protein